MGASPKGRGIYAIRNTVNGRVYVGLASNLARRFTSHRSALRMRRHLNSRLQQDWTDMGEHSFVFEVVEEVPEGTWLISREQHYINVLQPYYNIIHPAQEPLYSRYIALPEWMWKRVRDYGGFYSEGVRQIMTEHFLERG